MLEIDGVFHLTCKIAADGKNIFFLSCHAVTGHVNGVDVFVLLSTNGGPFTVYIVDEVMQELGIPSQFAALAFVAGAVSAKHGW